LIEDPTDAVGLIVGLAITYAATKLLAIILEWIGHRVSFYIATQTEDSWRYAGLKCCLSLPLAYLDQTDSAASASKIERAGSNVWVLLSIIIGNEIFIKLFTFLSVITTALIAAPAAWFIFVGPLPFYVFLSRRISAKISAYQEELNLMTEAASTTIHDALSNCRHVKTFGREQFQTLRYAARWGTFHNHEYRLMQLQFIQVAFQNVFRIGLQLGLILWCYSRIKEGVMSVGDMTMLVSYLDMTMAPVDSLSSLYPRAVRHVQRVKPIVELFRKQDPLQDADDAKNLAPLQSFLTLHDVHFAYTSQLTLGKSGLHSIPALRGATFTIPRGSTTAIVGPSGAGKSTLTQLLLRFYDPDSGVITWDGTPLTKATRSSLRKQITLVPQDTTLFNRSVRENISYGFPEASLADVTDAAMRAMAHEFISKLPRGYDTIGTSSVITKTFLPNFSI
jgi:ABC-type multidrug transport system fused ATPase/permease subunit